MVEFYWEGSATNGATELMHSKVCSKYVLQILPEFRERPMQGLCDRENVQRPATEHGKKQ